jgi:hypothetical protein
MATPTTAPQKASDPDGHDPQGRAAITGHRGLSGQVRARTAAKRPEGTVVLPWPDSPRRQCAEGLRPVRPVRFPGEGVVAVVRWHSGSMRLGVFLLAARFPGQSDDQVLAATVRAAVAAEQAGFDDVWLAEHHFMSYGICPSAVTLAGYILGRTQRVAVGTAASAAVPHPPGRHRRRLRGPGRPGRMAARPGSGRSRVPRPDGIAGRPAGRTSSPRSSWCSCSAARSCTGPLLLASALPEIADAARLRDRAGRRHRPGHGLDRHRRFLPHQLAARVLRRRHRRRLLPGRLRLDRSPPALAGAPASGGTRSRPLNARPRPL